MTLQAKNRLIPQDVSTQRPPPTVFQKSTIARQLGQSWYSLDKTIQERFQKDPEHGETIEYTGKMKTIRRSKMGWLFAYLTRIIGNPLSPYEGEDVQMDVLLFKKPNKSGTYWQRTYYYKGKKPFVVTSVKREGKKGEMMECVGGGFGMLLNVYHTGKELHFVSTRYFCEALGIRALLPHWLSPGRTYVIHRDLGDNKHFIFEITMHHKQLGETFYQIGTFHRQES